MEDHPPKHSEKVWLPSLMTPGHFVLLALAQPVVENVYFSVSIVTLIISMCTIIRIFSRIIYGCFFYLFCVAQEFS